MSSWLPSFSHIYVEEEARSFARTTDIIKRFPRAEVISIGRYREVFARSRQDFSLQKRSMKLILAVKKDGLLYPGSSNAQDFGYPNFHYNSLILNCLYDCGYCYLQGMYPSANIVLFVNLDDFFAAAAEGVKARPDPSSPLYLAISYDTDLLAFETIVPYCREWIAFTREEEDLLIEIRTKSAHLNALDGIHPHPRAVLAWTLSPPAVAAGYEKLTPAPQRRLEAAARALAQGWEVRLCFDPVIPVPGWRDIYREFFAETFATLHPEAIRDASIGVFRMNGEYFSRLKKIRPDSDLPFQTYEREGKTVTLPHARRLEITAEIESQLQAYIPREKIAVWT